MSETAQPVALEQGEPPLTGDGNEPRRTDPKTALVGVLQSAQNAILPIIAVAFGAGPWGLMAAIPLGLGIVGLGTLFSYLQWRRRTYTVGVQDIRVESGLISRSARSVPYERIQDVSLEQKLIPRLLGLVTVKFETGSGGGEDLDLSYLSEAEGERLRQLVRARREGAPVAAGVDAADTGSVAAAEEEQAQTLFAMGPGRIFTFGLFEFSLAVFAVLAGLTQYADSFFDVEVYDPDTWIDAASSQAGWIEDLGAIAQVIGAVAGLIGVFVIGSATGLVRTFAREWGFLLERTERGFRRRRGLFTKTDVVMPVHRVQGIKIGTGWLRYRFGWHGLRFVSLAQDAGAANHVVAPFARMEEIAPIAEAAGFHLPQESADWHRASTQYRTDSALIDASFFIFAAIAGGTATAIFAPRWSLLVIAVALTLAAIAALGNIIAWQFKRHALDDSQIMARAGLFSPYSQVSRRVKLHSVEISQGPIARLRGYATLHLGLAGGEFAIPGVPVERAKAVRRALIQSMTAKDFSALETA